MRWRPIVSILLILDERDPFSTLQLQISAVISEDKQSSFSLLLQLLLIATY